MNQLPSEQTSPADNESVKGLKIIGTCGSHKHHQVTMVISMSRQTWDYKLIGVIGWNSLGFSVFEVNELE